MSNGMMRHETLSEMIEALEAGARLDSEVQREAAESAVCLCCGEDKRHGNLLCQNCYSMETPAGLAPFKHSGMIFSRWLERARQEKSGALGLKVVKS